MSGAYIFIVISFVMLLNSIQSFVTHRSIINRIVAHQPHCTSSNINDIVSLDQFNEVTKLSLLKPVIIDFQKSKCKPCIRIAPDFEILASKYITECSFYKVDADTSKDALAVLKEQGIKSVPTFQLWVNGGIIEVIQGAHLDELEQALTDELKKIKNSANVSY